MLKLKLKQTSTVQFRKPRRYCRRNHLLSLVSLNICISQSEIFKFKEPTAAKFFKLVKSIESV